MRYIDIPSKVLEANVTDTVALDLWPYDDGAGDPFWAGGSNPKPYRWQLILATSEQEHSSYKTRAPYKYNGMDVKIGDYVADIQNGVAVKIISLSAKTEESITCIVEDTLRYNTLRYAGGLGNGLFDGTAVVIFEVNEQSLPVIDPVPPNGVGAYFFTNLMSRFQNLEQDYNYLLEKEDHGFAVDTVISADPSTNSFVATDVTHPYVIGTVSYTDLGPNAFMINPIQKINTFDYLIGDVGDVIFADETNPGGMSLAGNVPVLVKLQNNTNSSVVGATTNPTTSTGYEFRINNQVILLGGDGGIDDFCDTVNLATGNTGVSAKIINQPSVAITVASDCAIGEPALLVPLAGPYPSATINGVLVEVTTVAEMVDGSTGYALEEQVADAINGAAISGIRAVAEDNKLKIYSDLGDSIDIVNVQADVNGNNFAGPSSGMGVPLSTAANTDKCVGLDAIDARAINLFDTYGSATTDFGLYSVENGTKAAAIFIEQGLRKASTYVVANIAGRDALDALPGDQCFVQDTGNGEWAHYIKTFDMGWTKISDKDSSETDAQSVEVVVNFDSDITGIIHTISNGRRVSFVTVTVTEAFDTAATISVGDSTDNDRLMTIDQNDLTAVGDFSTTPSYTYTTGSDTAISYYFNAASATQGSAIIAITYT